MSGWNDFFVAEAGASAALAGLIFVGISISLDDLIRFPHLLNRAASALILLVSVLITSSLMLAPPHSPRGIGWELTGVGLVTVGIVSAFGVNGWRTFEPSHRMGSIVAIVLREIAALSTPVGGIAILARGDLNGLYWLLPAFIVAFIAATVDAWVILVEVHR